MNIKDKLATLPKKPGVYMHKDSSGTVIYVGKAINLFNRVNSYFRGAHDYKTTKLVSNIVDFDYIVTKSEKEALILEYNLIKEHDPKFNIVFKDDKSYPYILLKDTYEPYVSVVRLKKKSKYKGKLFGPYTDVTAARNVVELINKLYMTRKCENLQKDFCLYYHIKQCPGYCKNSIDNKLVEETKDEIIEFLNGNTANVLNRLKDQMKKCTETYDYENAAVYRDLINDVNISISKQDVQKNNNETFDVFNYDIKDGRIAITGLFIRKGKLLSSDKYLDYLVGDEVNFVTSYIYQFYNINGSPKKLYVPNQLLPFLKDTYDCAYVTRGYKYQLLKQAKLNSSETIKQNKKIIIRTKDYSDNLKDEFFNVFNKNINRIELFDNSHTGGKNTVGAMVVYKNFKPSKKDYRLFKLDDSANDISSMNEMLYRRYFRVLKDNLERPDLIIVDGGKTQIDIAKKVLESLNMNITIVGLGKDNHHNTSYLMDSDLNIIPLQSSSNIFFFLATMQDEVHRFAITYHKKLRQKSVYKSILDDIKGLGPKSRLKLLKKYKTISKIKELSLAELQNDLNNNVAEALYNKLREND